MAKVTVSTENDVEAATLAEAIDKHGPAVVNELVTNWLEERKETYARERTETIVRAAAVDPSYAKKVLDLHSGAEAIHEAKRKTDAEAAKKKAAADAKKEPK